MNRMPFEKYRPYPAIELPDRTWPDNRIEAAPIWCSVDLRDGNQALVDPMDITRKRRMWDHLVKIGFKEIEVGFPAASQPDFDFVRHIIEDGLIPDDVTIQVLTQARGELIERTFEAVDGAKNVIVHLYNSTSTTQRRVVFNKDRQGIIDIAVAGAEVCQACYDIADNPGIRWEYSPESFTGTEPDYAVEVCEAVMDVFKPTPDNPIIFNLPATVEMCTANLYGDLIEQFHRNVKNRDSIILSLHPHNDRGTGVAAAEFGLMAGADRVEGTLFGNGERTGNLDVINVAINLFTQGVDPELDLSDIDEMRRVAEFSNRLPVAARHPWVGDLVYTSFSGSHQDAIKKGMAAIYNVEEGGTLAGDYQTWDVPYLPIDPKHLGRSYEAVIRVNSQSGKGGVAYLMLHEYGLDLPRALQVNFSQRIQAVTEDSGTDITSYEIQRRFMSTYVEDPDSPIELLSHHSTSGSDEEALITAKLMVNGVEREFSGSGNGPIDAFINALRESQMFEGKLVDYVEHAVGTGSDTGAAAYVEIDTGDRDTVWGVGLHESILTASFRAVVSAVNGLVATGSLKLP